MSDKITIIKGEEKTIYTKDFSEIRNKYSWVDRYMEPLSTVNILFPIWAIVDKEKKHCFAYRADTDSKWERVDVPVNIIKNVFDIKL